MLSEAQFALQQRALGHRVHEHDGVYWEERYPLYCKPAFPFKTIDRGRMRPARLRSILGYSHLVPHPAQGNQTLPVMMLTREQLAEFNLLSLSSKKRNQVRRALERCMVLPIVDIEAHLERIREINIVQALRQEQGAGAEGPSARYTDEAESWREQVRREFVVGVGREWWGAFVEGTLTAYIRTYQVDGTRVILQTKADTSYFKFYPVDALYFTVLLNASEDSSCRCIINGSPLHPSLNHFKEHFLFKPIVLPCFSSYSWLTKIGKQMIKSCRGRKQKPLHPMMDVILRESWLKDR